MNGKDDTIKYHPNKCLYCGNPNPLISKRTRLSIYSELAYGIDRGIQARKGSKQEEESQFLRQPVIVSCPICNQIYEVVCLDDTESKNFVKNLVNTAFISSQFESGILSYMKKNNISKEDIYLNLIGVTVPREEKYRKLWKRKKIKFHILFHSSGFYYFAVFIKKGNQFYLLNIQKNLIFRGGL